MKPTITQRRGSILVVCVIYSSRVCPKCELILNYLQNHSIEHMIRMVEHPEVKVDALMLNIYSTPALVIGDHVLHQTDLFESGRLNEGTVLTFLRRHGHGEA